MLTVLKPSIFVSRLTECVVQSVRVSLLENVPDVLISFYQKYPEQFEAQWRLTGLKLVYCFCLCLIKIFN